MIALSVLTRHLVLDVYFRHFRIFFVTKYVLKTLRGLVYFCILVTIVSIS